MTATDEAKRAAGEWLLSDKHGMHYGADFERRVASLASMITTYSDARVAVAIGQAADIVTTAAQDCEDGGLLFDEADLSMIAGRVAALSPNPSLVAILASDMDVLRDAAERDAERIENDPDRDVDTLTAAAEIRAALARTATQDTRERAER